MPGFVFRFARFILDANAQASSAAGLRMLPKSVKPSAVIDLGEVKVSQPFPLDRGL